MKIISPHLSGVMVILLLLISAYVRAEEPVTIQGRIIDQNKQPVPFASVYITLPQNPTSIVKGAISNEKGGFSLSSGRHKSYLLKVMFMGYKEHSMKIQTDSVGLNLGDITLEEVSYKMSEVVVKPPLQVTAEKIIFNFENDPNRSKSSLHDMISKMPMIHVDDMGMISVGSKGEKYIVLRKGREDALVNFQNVSFEEMLKRLPAMGFTSFEIWTVIPPKYEQYDYVINIIPDPTQRLFGAVGSPEAYYSSNNGVLRTGLGGNASADIFRVAGGVKYEYMDAPKDTRETQTTFYAKNDAPESLFNQKEKSFNNSDTWQANLTTSLDISKRQFISFNFNASFSDSKNRRQTISEKMVNETSLSRSISNYITKYKSDSWSLGATYQLDFKKPDRSLNISYLLGISPSQRHNNREMDYTAGTDEDTKISVGDDVEKKTHRIQFDYFDHFLKNKLKFNAQAGYLIQDYQSEGITLDELTGIEDIHQYTYFEQELHRIDGLVNFSYNVNKRLNISAKANVDYLPNYNTTKSITGTFEEYIEQKEFLFNLEGKISHRFTIPNPWQKEEKPYDEMTPAEQSAYMIKRLSSLGAGESFKDVIDNISTIVPNSSLRFNYMYNQRRPGVRQLTNYSDEQDPLYIKRGNPNLAPEAYHSLYMTFSSWFINNFSASFSDDKVVSQTRREGDKVVQSFYNSGKTRNFSVGMSQPFFKNKLTMSSNFSSYYTDFGNENSRKQQNFNLQARYSLRIFNTFSSNFDLNYYKTFNSGTEGEEDVFPLNLSMSLLGRPQIWGKQLLISVGANDILRWDKKTRRYADMPDYQQTVETKHRGLPLYFSISTTLGKFKVKPVKATKSSATVRGFSTDTD